MLNSTIEDRNCGCGRSTCSHSSNCNCAQNNSCNYTCNCGTDNTEEEVLQWNCQKEKCALVTASEKK